MKEKNALDGSNGFKVSIDKPPIGSSVNSVQKDI
jgi:hypothetical protein